MPVETQMTAFAGQVNAAAGQVRIRQQMVNTRQSLEKADEHARVHVVDGFA